MMPKQEPGRLLIVDDNKVNRILLGRGLEADGHKIETAENGKQALEKLRAGFYDLVLLDIEMPEMNGYQVLEHCLQDDELRNIPIIMTSSLDEIASVIKCVELGAEDYLNKPVNPVLLRARVNASLEKKRLRDQQRKLIRTFATQEVAEELLKTGFSLGGSFVTASVMFADIRSFTTITESRSPAEIIEMLNDYYALMFEAITSHGGSVNQMIGDGLMAIFGMNFGVWAPLLARDALDIGASGFGLLMSSVGVGSLAGALTLAFRGRRPAPRVMLAAALLFGVLEIALGFVAGLGLPAVLAMALMAGIGFAMSTTMAQANTTVQTNSPDHLRGRVMSIYLTVFAGSTPIGAALAGFIAGIWGAPAAVAIGGAVVAAVALALGGRLARLDRGVAEDVAAP